MDLPGNMANVTVVSGGGVNSSNVNAASSAMQAQSINCTMSTANQNNSNSLNDNEPINVVSTSLEECLICSDLKRDTIFKVNKINHHINFI